MQRETCLDLESGPEFPSPPWLRGSPCVLPRLAPDARGEVALRGWWPCVAGCFPSWLHIQA